MVCTVHFCEKVPNSFVYAYLARNLFIFVSMNWKNEGLGPTVLSHSVLCYVFFRVFDQFKSSCLSRVNFDSLIEINAHCRSSEMLLSLLSC